MKKSLIALFFICINFAFSQVKVGDHINTIDASSIMELESASKVFVVTRISNAQMNAITPLNGALAFNTDEECLFQYRNNAWVSLCVDIMGGQTITALIDNKDGTFTYINESGVHVLVSKATLTNNGDGTFTFSNGALTNITIDTNASAIPFNNTSSGLTATNVQDAINELQTTLQTDDDITGVSFDGTDLTVDEGTTSFSADLSALEESAAIAAVQADVDQNETDADAAIAAVQADVDQNETDADAAIAANATAIAAHNTADLDIDATNELSDLNLTGTTLTLTNAAAGATGVDLAGFVSTDDQNLESATLSAASELAVNIENGNDVTVDLSALEESAAIAAVQADVDQNETDADNAIAANATAIAAHNTADLDIDATNELSDLNLTGTTLTLTNAAAGATGVDLAGFVSTDDQNLESATLSAASELAVNIENGNDVTVDLSALEESAAIAAVQADVDQNETDADNAIAAVQADVDQNETDADAAIAANATAIAAHNTADLDIDATNELSDLNLTGTTLTLTNAAAGATGVDLAGFVSTDDQNLESATLSAASELAVNIENGNDVTVDLSALEESAAIAAVQADVDQNETDADAAIAAVQADVDQNETDADNAIAANATAIAAHNTADLDIDATNELSDLNLTGTTLTLTNAAAGATGVDLAGFVSTDDQNLESATLSAASELAVNIENGNDVTVDLSALEESAAIAAVQADVDQNETDADAAIAAVQADVDQNETDADAAIAAVQADVDQNETDADTAIAANATAIAAHNTADLDIDATNELSDLNLTGTTLTLTNAAAGATGVDLAGFVSTDDQNLESATLSAASELAVNIENGNDVTVDLSALEESAAIAAVQADVDQNETDADNAIAAVQADVDQNETDADAAIAANATAIAAHNTADLDIDATNELSDLNLTGTTLTLTNAAAGATGVDLAGFVSTDDQNLESATLSAASELAVNIENGNDVTVDLSALEESAAIAAVQADVDQNETDADNAIAANATAIAAHNTADLDIDATNELSDLNLTGTTLTLTNAAAGATGVDLAGFVSTDDQNLESATLSAASELAVNIENGNDVTVDLSALEESAAIAAVQADVDQNETDADNAIAAVQADVDQNETDADAAIAANATAIAAHNTADLDIDATNELSDLNLTGTTLTLTNAAAGATGVDLAGFVSTDDQNLESATLSAASELAVNIENGNDVTVDLSALEESAAIAAVQADVDQNETDADNAIAANATAIAAHNTADLDIDATNELSDLNLTGTTLTLTNAAAGATGVDLAGFVSTDDQNLESATLSAASELAVNIENGNDVTVDLSALEESAAIAAVQADVDQNETDADTAIAANATAIAAHNTADLDIDTTNELSDLNLTGTTLTLTNAAAGATGVDLAGFVSTDDQNLESATLSAASELAVNIENGNDVTVDLSALEESAAIAAVQADVDQNETDADNAIAAVQADVDQNETDADAAIAANATAIAAHNTADLDIDATNELSDLNLTGTTLTLTNAAAGATGVDLAGFVSTDDQNLESATLSAASELAVNIENGNDVTVDLSALEESAAIAAVQADVDQNETDADNAIAAVQADVDQNETDADAAIAANATAIAAHNTADLDIDTTNELSDLNLTGTTLTLTNAAAGATGVDLAGFVSTDDQNLESATLSAASELAVNIENGNDVTVDLSALEESAAIAAVQADVDQNETDADNAIAANATAIAAHNTADLDIDATNELSDLNLTGTTLTLTNAAAGATGVDLAGFVSTDDQNLESATLSAASELAVNIENGNDVTVDLSALEESATIAAVQADVDQNETDADNAIAAVQADVDQNETDADAAIAANATAIAAHNTADLDIDATNELSDLNLTGTTLTLTNAAAGATGVDLAGFVSTDDQNLESATLSAASELAVNIENGNDVTVDLSALEESAAIAAVQADVDQNETDADNAIAAVQADVDQNETDADAAIAANATAIAAHNTADLDIDATNELSDLNLTGTTLTLTNAAAGATGVDLAGFVSTDDQNLESATLSAASELAVNIENGNDVTVDLSALEESAAIAAVQADVDQNETDADTAIAANATAIAAHNTADLDIDATNEIQILSIAGNDLSISGTGGNMVTLPSISGTQGSVFFANTDGTPTEDNAQFFWDNSNNRLGIGTASPSNKLEVSGAIRSQGVINSNGTIGEPSYRFSSDTNTGFFRPAADEIGISVGGVEAIRIDETSNNTTVTINETLELEGKVLDENDSAGTVGQILTATATGTEWSNSSSLIKAIGKIASNGGITRATSGITITKQSGNGHYRVNLPVGMVSDSNYIIQLSQPGRAGAGNDDPGISYSNQNSTGFDVIIGDNDNGGTDRSRYNSEFMFTVLDL